VWWSSVNLLVGPEKELLCDEYCQTPYMAPQGAGLRGCGR
jgi:hypothetical protein